MTVRRTFLAGALAVALAPRAATAQPGPRALRLGVLLYSNATTDPNLRAFREALRDLGYVEGQNLTVDYRAGEGHPERLPDLAAQLVRARPQVILALGGDVAPFATAATTTIPIVFAISSDPVRGKLVKSLAHPAGNATGLTFLSAELAPKRLQFLREAAPRASRLAILWSPEHFDDEFRDTETAARAAGLHVQSLEMRGRAADLEAAFQAAAAWRCDALIAVSSRHTFLNRRAIVDFANRQRVPLAGGWGAWADEGGLLSYGPDLNAFVRRAAIFVDRIVRGANPADLPREQPTKLDLVVNAKTAEMLGLAVPPSRLVRADRIIE
jgi:putative tryptophan/tyrosine transport system substrate-binding protein